MDFLKEHVGTQYQDYTGLVSIDFHGISQDLFSMARDFEIDTSEKFPIALKFYEFTTQGIGRGDTLNVTIYTVDKKVYGESFDEIEKYIRSKDGRVVVSENRISVPYQKIGKYIKRFDVLAINNLRSAITEFEIEEED